MVSNELSLFVRDMDVAKDLVQDTAADTTNVYLVKGATDVIVSCTVTGDEVRDRYIFRLLAISLG